MDSDAETLPLEESPHFRDSHGEANMGFGDEADDAVDEPVISMDPGMSIDGIEPEKNGSAGSGVRFADDVEDDSPSGPYASAAAVTLDVDEDEAAEEEKEHERQRMYFEYNGEHLRVDYVLVYQVTEDKKSQEKEKTREIYQANVERYGLIVHNSPHADITDPSLHYVLLHAPWEALTSGAELLSLKKRLKMSNFKSLQDKLDKSGCMDSDCCSGRCMTSQEHIPDEGDFFTAPFHHNRLDLFEIGDRDTFFTNAERSLVAKEILDRSSFTPETSEEVRFGISRLLGEKVYSSAYPLHEGPFKQSEVLPKENQFEGEDKDRQLLYETWARPARWCCYQPLDLIRKYFGEKIGLYFAWLGFYTQMLIPATLLGVAAFIYGLITMFADPIGNDICDNLKEVVMCPQCNVRCGYWFLEESCIYSRITYLFDNYATIVFTILMGIWATVFLEFWKRKQNELQYEWDVQDFESQERMRPEFEFKVRRRKENPITNVPEPYLTGLSRCCRGFTSLSIAIFFVLMVVGTIIGVIVYRVVVVTILYNAPIDFVSTWAKIITSLTASVINLIVIMILGLIYRRVAYFLTELEMLRTETDFEDAYTFKMFMFQFVNFYGTTFYIAYFKGKFQAQPGSTSYYLFGRYEPDVCDPSGCMIDLLIQLFIVMVGKQALNNAKEIIIPYCCVRKRKAQAQKDETEGGLYLRWMQDRDMQQADRLMLFEEYLEMVIQYGFVTIFVAAFPLAPLFALLNNIIEIRLDAYKLVTQYQRPRANKAQDIGVWYSIMQSITFIAILSNAVIIAWTSDFIPRMVYILVYSTEGNLEGYVNNSLSYFDTAHYTNSTAPESPGTGFTDQDECRYKGFRRSPTDDRAYDFTEQFWHVVVARLAFILVFEHCLFLLTYMLAYMIPDVSGSVRRLKAYEKALNRHLTFKSTFQEKEDQQPNLDTYNY